MDIEQEEYFSQVSEYCDKGIKLVLTCGACPEQYDAYHGDKKVGYLRLRHGYFAVTYPWVDGELLYDDYPHGDGMFEGYERKFYLDKAIEVIKAKIKEAREND